MDEELKTYLDGKFAQVDARFAQVDARFAQVEGSFAEMREALRDTETRLLSEFWKRGRTTEIRVRRLEGQDAWTAERLAAMEERIFTLERKAAGSKE